MASLNSGQKQRSRKQARSALAKGGKRFLTAVTDIMPGMIGYWDNDLRCRFANTAYAEWFEKQPQDLIGCRLDLLVGERAFSKNEPYIRRALNGEKQKFDAFHSKPDGAVVHALVQLAPDIDESGKVCGYFTLFTDVTALKEAEARLRESENRYRMLAENATDMVFQLDREGVRRYVSPASREILGYEPDELIGIRPVNQIHPEDEPRVQRILQSLLEGETSRDSVINRIRHRDGRWIWVEADFRALKDPKTGVTEGIVGALRDISVRKSIQDQLNEANRQLEILAAQDALTGLANRRLFDQTLVRQWNKMMQDGTQIALIMIDVDWFKRFNDRYGHPAGDQCLRQVSAAIGSVIHRSGDLAARYGGEEFVVLLPGTDENGAAVVADRIREAVSDMNITHEESPKGNVTISAGLASLDSHVNGGFELLAGLADRALYRAKECGRNQIARASELGSIDQSSLVA